MPKEIFYLIMTLLVTGFAALMFLNNKYIKILQDLKSSKKESYYDSYTGLSSNAMFKDNLMYIMNNANDGTKLVILSLDLGSLDAIGKLLSTDNHDLLLKESISRIKSCVRSNDLITRVNDDNFFISLPRVTGYDNIEMVAQRIMETFSEVFLLNGKTISLNVFLGISVYPENGTDIDLLLNNADTSRHRAKSTGENNYYFYVDELNNKAKETDLLLSDMRKSIVSGDFTLCYQPIYSLNSNSISGVEALVRWHHPKRGIIPPSEFIPLAETSGLIVPLSYWILKEACRQYKEWDIPDLKLSVNISALQFKQVDLVQKIREIIKQEGMNTKNLNLEVTETTSMADIKTTLKVLTELREMGMAISIDDFGTGYSSLAYLKQFPITTLKIDRSFVTDIEISKDGEAVIKTIIALAKILELNVIAEGVETKEQLDFLGALGCDKIQGYLIAKPLTPNEFSTAIKTGELAYGKQQYSIEGDDSGYFTPSSNGNIQ